MFWAEISQFFIRQTGQVSQSAEEQPRHSLEEKEIQKESLQLWLSGCLADDIRMRLPQNGCKNDDDVMDDILADRAAYG